MDKISKEIFNNSLTNTFRVHFDYLFFNELILNNYKDDSCAVELVRVLPEIHIFFDIQTIIELINATFQIYGKTSEPGFRNKAMKSIAMICPKLPESNLVSVVSRMKELIYTTWEYTETAALVEAFTYIAKNTKLDSLEVYKILIVVKQFLVHPNNLILQKTRDLIKHIYETAPKEDIHQVVAPILLPFTKVDQSNLRTEEHILLKFLIWSGRSL